MSIYEEDKNNWFFWIFCENKKGTISEVKMKLEIEVLFIAAMPGGRIRPGIQPYGGESWWFINWLIISSFSEYCTMDIWNKISALENLFTSYFVSKCN